MSIDNELRAYIGEGETRKSKRALTNRKGSKEEIQLDDGIRQFGNITAHLRPMKKEIEARLHTVVSERKKRESQRIRDKERAARESKRW